MNTNARLGGDISSPHPFKALGAVMSLFSGDEEESEGLNPYHLTKEQEEVVKGHCRNGYLFP